jgi:hypothetical protein
VGTKAFAIKEALITLAKARPGLAFLDDDDAIWDSAYSGQQRPRQVLWFGEILWTYDQNVTRGKTPSVTSREEEFNIRVGIEINDNDTVQKEANDKAEAIMHEVEAMMGDYQQFGIDGIVTIGVVPIGLGEGPGSADGVRAAFMALQINARVRK